MVYEQIHTNGYQWLFSADHCFTPYVTLAIAYGLLDEPVGALGTLDHLARLLRNHLSEPFVTQDNLLIDTPAAVQVRPSSLLISVQDERPEVLRALWGRIASTFASASLPALAPKRSWEYVWYDDMALRTGANALSMNWIPGITADVHTKAIELLRHIRPGGGNRHCVMLTSDRSLVGAGFTEVPLCSTTPEMVSPLDVEPLNNENNRECQVLVDQTSQEVMTVVGPLSPETFAAVHLLLQDLGRVVQETAPEAGLEAVVSTLGRLMHVLVLFDGQSIPVGDTRRRIVEQLLFPGVPPSDEAVRAACAHAAAWAQQGNYVSDCLLHGLEVSIDQPTEAAARYAYDMLRRTRHLAVERNQSPLPGLEIRPAFVAKPRGWRWFERATRNNDPRAVIIGKEAIGVVPSLFARGEFEAVDAANLAAVVEDEHGAVDLFDQANRVTTIVVPAYYFPGALRRRLNAATAGVPRLTGCHSPAMQRVRAGIVRSARKARTTLIILYGFLTIFLAGVFTLALIQILTESRPQSLEATYGETVRLRDGSSILVSQTPSHSAGSSETSVIFSVEHCQKSDAPGESPVTGANFIVNRVDSSTPELSTFTPTTASDRCSKGDLEVPNSQPAADRVVVFRDARGNTVQFTEER